jgi:predicted short-subunit dehydrogenase-like oxidoreductase (DUF2520 family)
VKEYRISFIGAGKVSGALCRQMYLSGCRIQRIVSRTEKNGLALAKLCNTSWSTELDFPETDDVIIAAVPDDALPEVFGKINCHKNTLVAHTAGSIGLDVFPSYLKHTGVFYPLQTFSENRMIDFNDLPFFLEASDPFSSSILKDLAESIGGKPWFVDTERRKLLHVAAVFVSNFTNHMLTSGNKIAEKAGFPFEVLKPLIEETILKAMVIGPDNSQTGPAFRHDEGTIKKHIDLLSFSPELQDVYKEVTRSIINSHKNRR